MAIDEIDAIYAEVIALKEVAKSIILRGRDPDESRTLLAAVNLIAAMTNGVLFALDDLKCELSDA